MVVCLEQHKYKCEQCRFYTDHQSVWKRHIETTLHKTGKRKIRCDKRDEPHKCPQCFYKTHQITALQHHIISAHSDSEKEKKEKFKYYCDLCKVGSLQKSLFEKHLKTQKHTKMMEYINN